MYTREEAKLLAQALFAQSPYIDSIELVGSVADQGQGNDIDFVVSVEPILAQEWWQRYERQIKVRWPEVLYPYRKLFKRIALSLYEGTIKHKKRQRLEGAAALLKVDLNKLTLVGKKTPDVELFLLPIGWRRDQTLDQERFATVTSLVNHANTRGFLARLAKQAIPISSDQVGGRAS